MNEEELKTIWGSEKIRDLQNEDFDKFYIVVKYWKSKLQNKIKFDLFFSLILLISLIPLCYLIPKLIYFIPIVLIAIFWGGFKLWNIYKIEIDDNGIFSVKESIEKQAQSLSNYIKKSRIILYFSIPFIVLASLLIQVTPQQLFEKWFRVLMLIIVSEVISIIFTEIYFRIVYYPSLDKSKELLRELENQTQ